MRYRLFAHWIHNKVLSQNSSSSSKSAQNSHCIKKSLYPCLMNRLSVSGVGQRKGPVIYTPRQSQVLMTTFVRVGSWPLSAWSDNSLPQMKIHKTLKTVDCVPFWFHLFLLTISCCRHQESILTEWHDADDAFPTITSYNGKFLTPPLKTMKGTAIFFSFSGNHNSTITVTY